MTPARQQVARRNRVETDRRNREDGDTRSRSLFNELDAFGDRIAIVDQEGREWSYRRLLEAADGMAALIGARRRVVALIAANSFHSLAAYVGARRAGHPVLLLGTGEPDPRLLRRFNVEQLCLPEEDGCRFKQIGDAPSLPHQDLAVLLSTSGTSGTPKLVRLSNRNVDSNALAIAEYLGFAPGERAMTTLPFNYSYGLSVVNSHLVTGNSIILSDRSIVDAAFWEHFDSSCATSFAGVPYSYELLERSGFLERPPPASLRYFTQAGGRLAPQQIRAFGAFAQHHGIRFFVMYGQTEASPRMAYVPPELVHAHPGTIGFPIPGGCIELIDERGSPIEAAGVEGELLYRGPNVMMGYALTAEDLARGHELDELRTGDLAVRDELGMITITGRKDRFVKLFGLKIGLDDIETMLMERELVAAAGGNDRQVRLFITDPDRVTEAIEIVRERYRLPAGSVTAMWLPALPRLPSGKLDYGSVAAIDAPAAVPAPCSGASLYDELAEMLGDRFDPAQSFASASGDSLSYVRVSLLLDEYLGSAPQGWEDLPLGELCARAPMPTAAAVEPRSLRYLDNMRAGLMLLGIPYHVAMAYSLDDWIAKANETSRAATWFTELSHTFRMPAFFVIAGFFAMLLIRNQPPARWLAMRARALLPPLLTTVLLLSPLLMLGRSLSQYGGWEMLNDWTRQLSEPGPHWIEHGWFLIFLLLYSIALASVWKRRDKLPGISHITALGGLLASWRNLLIVAITAGAAVAAIVMLLTAFQLNFMFWEMLWTSSLVSLAPLFALGCVIAMKREYLDRFVRFDWPSFIIAVVSVASLAAIQERFGVFYRGATFLLVPIAGIFATRLLMALCRRWLTGTGRVLDLLVESSMTVYLVHQVFVVFLVILFNRFAIPPLAEAAIISLIALVASLAVHLLVRRSPLLGFLLSGTLPRHRATSARVQPDAGSGLAVEAPKP